MTRDEILALEPGREMDALVADVAGFKNICYMEPIKMWVGDIDGETNKRIPNFSAHISLAWEVFGTLFPVLIGRSYKETYEVGEIGWHVNWCDTVQEDDEDGACTHGKEVWAKTAPEAICKAALLIAKEKEEG